MRFEPKPGAAARAIALVPVAVVVWALGQTGGNKMDEIFLYRKGPAVAVQPETRKIHPAPLAPLPPAPLQDTGFRCPWANQQCNSRSPYPLPAGEWRLRWRSELEPVVQPAYILQARDRILLRGREWRLLDMQGENVFVGSAAGGTMVVDAAKERFYRMGGGGNLAAVRLADGKPIFLYLPSRGDAFTRTLIDRRGDRILIGGVERELAPMDRGRKAVHQTMLQTLDVAEPVQTTEFGTLTSGTVNGRLELPTSRTMFAVAGDTIAAVTPGRIYIIDWDLNIRRALEAEFEPVNASLDEAARMYLVTQVDSRYSLWVVTPEGDCPFTLDLPRGISRPAIPPIVAYDHSVYLIGGRQIIAVGADGKLNWNRPSAAEIAGAIVMPDGRLVVSEGSSVAAWSPEGKREVLFQSGGDRFQTPPALTASGELLVASASRLYCLAARKPAAGK